MSGHHLQRAGWSSDNSGGVGVALGGASFFSERSPSVSEGGLSEELKNREGVASGSATAINIFVITEQKYSKKLQYFHNCLYYKKVCYFFMKIELNVIKDNNHVDKDISKEEMEKILLACLKESNISHNNILLNVTFCNRETMLKLNRETRNEHHATNVLSCFPKKGLINNLVKSGFIQADQVDKYIGDIVFCIDVVEEEAEKLKIPPKERYYMLFAHALYHALGLDHQTKDDKEMFNNLIIRTLLNFGIKDPYLYNCYDDTDVD